MVMVTVWCVVWPCFHVIKVCWTLTNISFVDPETTPTQRWHINPHREVRQKVAFLSIWWSTELFLILLQVFLSHAVPSECFWLCKTFGEFVRGFFFHCVNQRLKLMLKNKNKLQWLKLIRDNLWSFNTLLVNHKILMFQVYYTIDKNIANTSLRSFYYSQNV